MRASWGFWISAAFLSSAVVSTETIPFSPPETVETNKRALEILNILKRSDNCPGGYHGCSNLGNGDACCKQGTNCSRDAADNIACCPTGAKCTGSLTSATTATGATGATGSSFMFPQTATATTTAPGAGSDTTGSTMSGAYPFVYVPTSFANPATCSSYFSQCQSEYQQCTGVLMGRYGVTVGGPGGAGTTVEAITASTQATSICSSLSVDACHGLQLGYCGTVETQTADAHDANGNAATPGRSSSLQDLVLGLAVAVAGMFI
ncbi:hypothetical protein NUU61_007918 [Penicillium alfredii]|uniref:Uncharacterized protein n=1 Tax=Penicillium alfredii TaxID=1506179 RepID=A0A9W9JZ08_9EURO|nr:uncharacterized protein NUU61_007918 [Penicillium alfredii]KAJ5086611.1 hypothetical protein NUU61_007918 [Penicillium alfredii]